MVEISISDGIMADKTHYRTLLTNGYRRIEMRKYLSLIGVLLVLVVFHLMPNVEALVLESDELLFYVSRALLLGMNFDFGGGDGLESYPSLSVQGSSGVFYWLYGYWRAVVANGGGYLWLSIDFWASKQSLF